MNVKAQSRREKISQASSTVFIAVAIASVIVALSAVSTRFLLQKKSYNDRVIEAKTKARDDIKTNLANVDALGQVFPALEESSTSNSKVILHAMPPAYDYPALAASMEQLAITSGVVLQGQVAKDESAAAIESASQSQPLELTLQFNVTGNYDNIVKFIENTQRSIRPIHISVAEFSGTNNSMTAIVTAKTYYQPTRSLDVMRSELK